MKFPNRIYHEWELFPDYMEPFVGRLLSKKYIRIKIDKDGDMWYKLTVFGHLMCYYCEN